MKNRFTKFWSGVTAYVTKQYQARPLWVQAALAFVLFAILGLIAISLIGSMFPKINPADQAPMPTLLATTTADPLRQVQATPQFTPSPTATPIPSNVWTVNQLMDPLNGALVVEFKNITTGETKKGLCQSPNDPEPAVGNVYIAEIKGDYILLSPAIPGTSQVDVNSKLQRFIFIP